MHYTTLLPLATAVLALPSKRDGQWGSPPGQHGGSGWPHGDGQPTHGWGPHQGAGSVAYFLENDPAGSNLISLNLAENGTLSEPLRTSTGGSGSIMVNSTGQSVGADSLGSQGSVTISGNMIFTVNAGSNTVSMFVIDEWSPHSPRLVGTPASTQGEFPISVTYSPELRKACVLNGGTTAGVTCYTVDPTSGLTIDGPLRQLTTTIINESTPPSGPPGSAAQVLFNPDSSAVFATVKANSTTGEGSLLVWPVTNGEISTAAPVVKQMSGIVLDFGFEFLNQSTIFLSDPSFGISLLEVGSDWSVTETAHTAITGQSAICWTEYEPALDTIYAIDAGKNSIFMLDPATGAMTGTIEVVLDGSNSSMGLFDSAIKGGLMYSLAGTNGIVTVDLAKEEQVAYLDLSGFGERQNYMGMAIYP